MHRFLYNLQTGVPSVCSEKIVVHRVFFLSWATGFHRLPSSMTTISRKRSLKLTP